MTDGLAGDKEREHKAGASKLTGLGGRPGEKVKVPVPVRHSGWNERNHPCLHRGYYGVLGHIWGTWKWGRPRAQAVG